MPTWYCNDNDRCIVVGVTNGVHYVGVIQRPDGYGGYNTQFQINNEISSYHIHFLPGSTRVTAVNYYAQQTQPTGDTIYRDPDGTQTLRAIIQNELDTAHFPNHHRLFNLFRQAIADVPKLPNNELQ